MTLFVDHYRVLTWRLGNKLLSRSFNNAETYPVSSGPCSEFFHVNLVP